MNRQIQDNIVINSKLPSTGMSIFSIMSNLANQHNAINLSQGFPDFNCPKELINLVSYYMKKGYNQYAPMPGIISLREKISAKIENSYNHVYNPEKEITITAGGTQAIYAAISAIVREDDEVIVFEPAYDCYVPAIQLSKGRPVLIPLELPDYNINWEKVKQRINFHTRMIIINTPHNPSGSVLTEEDMKQLQKLTAGTNIIILSDEVYEHIIYDDLPHQSICKYNDLVNRSLVVFSFGKTYHSTGWKMGYVLAPEKLTNELRKVYQFMMYACNTPFQYAYSDFIDNSNHYHELPQFYQKKRDMFRNLLKNSRFEILPCKGTYFQCVSYKNISDQSDTEFANYLTEKHKVAAIPVSVFYKDKTDSKVLRFCFAKSEKTLKKAAKILGEV